MFPNDPDTPVGEKLAPSEKFFRNSTGRRRPVENPVRFCYASGRSGSAVASVSASPSSSATAASISAST
jgi:hypothetical protein